MHVDPTEGRSPELGGAWLARSPHTMIRGYSLRPRTKRRSEKSSIATGSTDFTRCSSSHGVGHWTSQRDDAGSLGKITCITTRGRSWPTSRGGGSMSGRASTSSITSRTCAIIRRASFPCYQPHSCGGRWAARRLPLSSFWRGFGIRGMVYESLRSLARHLGELDPFVRMTARRSSIAGATTAETSRPPPQDRSSERPDHSRGCDRRTGRPAR